MIKINTLEKNLTKFVKFLDNYQIINTIQKVLE